MRCTSGLFALDRVHELLEIVVLPAFGGETMRPRWPFPIGEMRSTIRPVASSGLSGSSSRSRSSGNSGVRSSKRGRSRASSGLRPLMWSTRSSAGYFSFDAGPREPVDEVALAQRERRTWDADHVDVAGAGQVAGGAENP